MKMTDQETAEVIKALRQSIRERADYCLKHRRRQKRLYDKPSLNQREIKQWEQYRAEETLIAWEVVHLRELGAL